MIIWPMARLTDVDTKSCDVISCHDVNEIELHVTSGHVRMYTPFNSPGWSIYTHKKQLHKPELDKRSSAQQYDVQVLKVD